ncbi:SPBc2 prophage-derived aminoglycoside N(3')-acetyltransferase-like protein YokD [Lactobacillus helveticus]|uniref:Aminoglycoside N(3)-acetyltransferase n=2 Tax=Lactobacillus helveticus TaxID=1587 RepID=A0A9Q5C214_LACHE|nr:SPBc2 prophage-derived aminoglycoside N(3')-acetyltransferase-like protein YokD [Lactobacillus helveticus]NRN91943.1 SPBc2 prophage-derived aminoglycoside N(3')-acetyltransferase-like protein YokD [Lactobacillus helveticus]NRN96160.1 SPBc2 prophage-derived aminoglycoside N(3')-acetyltransferase-like protein YokD [Lactobacillus helveticus]NRO14891.1 SPBc2 prophage-derived aminoglycoside N(3')-acetyltransferase-like protein YokD [Lactobacillus helveticus]NRO53519.1 SPBc2 prophage-derived amino
MGIPIKFMIKIVQKEFYSFVKRESKNAISRKIIKTVMSAKKLKKILAEHLKPTDSIEVHTSLSAFGYIPGGEQSVVKVLKEVVNQGNIIMAAQTADIGDPIDWEDPPATPEAEKEIIENMPAYDKEITPIHYIGKTPEYFRTSKDVKRSDHPLYSMCAWGKRCR